MKEITILVIEDNPVHMAEAKRVMEILQTEGAPIRVLYAENYVEYRHIVETETIDGVLSDIFFPYSKEEPWDSEIARECKNLMQLFFPTLEERWQPGAKEKTQKWINGNSGALHPTGILIAKEMEARDIPAQFESDVAGHGSMVEPAFRYIASLRDGSDGSAWKKSNTMYFPNPQWMMDSIRTKCWLDTYILLLTNLFQRDENLMGEYIPGEGRLNEGYLYDDAADESREDWGRINRLYATKISLKREEWIVRLAQKQ